MVAPDDTLDLASLPEEELHAKGGHLLSVARLAKLCDPLASWAEQDSPITRQEVLDCIKRNEAALVDTPLWTSIMFGGTEVSPEENRRRHIQKIAWFVLHPATDAISLEVGCESLGCLPGHLVEDGNHRLAAAIVRKDKTIRAHVGGGVSDAKRMKLWNPNAYELELVRRHQAARKGPRRRAP